MDDHLKTYAIWAGLGAALGVGVAVGLGLRALAAGAAVGVGAGAAVGLAGTLKRRPPVLLEIHETAR
ncbi:MAG: hypothetical protein E7812_04725 [Phenylobacterium sp.]|nr:MAG: hypothetical protein E7812_04725 [Phenylobacterium sp.]